MFLQGEGVQNPVFWQVRGSESSVFAGEGVQNPVFLQVRGFRIQCFCI